VLTAFFRLVAGWKLREQRAAAHRLRGWVRVCAVAASLGLAVAQTGEAFAQTTPEKVQGDDDRVRPILARHCFECHGVEKPKGDFRLDRLSTDFADEASREKWLTVLERLRKGEMPPKAKPRPSAEEVRVLSDWISNRVELRDAGQRAAQGRVVLRRLNRVEYENTVCDLLGIKVNLKEQLPEDGSADGFDNAGAAHHTSSFLMEKYLEAAETALNAAIANRPQPPPRVDKRYSMKDTHQVKSTTENVYRFLDDGEVVCFCSSEWHNVGVTHFYPPDAGNYRFRISAAGFQSGDKPVTFRVTASGTRLTGTSGLVSYFDAPPGKPIVFEFVRYMEPRTTISMLPYGLAGANTVKQVGGEDWTGPGLAIQYVEVQGPLHETWPPESHRRIFGDLAQQTFGTYNFRDRVEVVSDQPLVDAERILKTFTRRAFRRTVTADDVAPFMAIVQDRLDAGYTFEPAMRAALKGVLISPEFLFLRERPGELDDFALACRLSYFLWSTMPDDELFTLAEQQKLSQPDVLRQQVERLLAHPKAAAFTENFVGQWLGLREIDATEPSHILYPEFDHLLKVSMIREAELFFDEVLKHDLSLTNFVASDFTMLNGRLAKHYRIPGVDGWEFHKTPLPPERHRGGMLTMAGVLKVTANGTTTSPVLRGAWVLDRILGTPPAPPPDNVPAIDPDIRGATTIREQLAKHRSVESCGVCHRTIDPPGFALESFDCIGGWRDNYRVTGNGETVIVDGQRMPYHKGKTVDPSDVMADGERFENIDQFKQLLLQDKPQLARALTTKLMTYSTGRAPQSSDRDAVAAIVATIAAQDYGLRSLVHEIVQSETFRNK
jgi:mono/diheme cytochrome c family protein